MEVHWFDERGCGYSSIRFNGDCEVKEVDGVARWSTSQWRSPNWRRFMRYSVRFTVVTFCGRRAESMIMIAASSMSRP